MIRATKCKIFTCLVCFGSYVVPTNSANQSGRYEFQIGWAKRAKPTFGQIFGWAGLVFITVLLLCSLMFGWAAAYPAHPITPALVQTTANLINICKSMRTDANRYKLFFFQILMFHLTFEKICNNLHFFRVFLVCIDLAWFE